MYHQLYYSLWRKSLHLFKECIMQFQHQMLLKHGNQILHMINLMYFVLKMHLRECKRLYLKIIKKSLLQQKSIKHKLFKLKNVKQLVNISNTTTQVLLQALIKLKSYKDSLHLLEQLKQQDNVQMQQKLKQNFQLVKI